MPIYKYNIKKYIKSPSTWIILIITIIMEITLGGIAPFSIGSEWIKRNTNNYAKISIILVTSMTSFLAIFASVFTSFKAATMFKDEIEDGTFLIMISKQISRKRILFEKWLSLQTTIIIYCFITALTFGITLYSFDIGHKINNINTIYGMNTLREKAHIISVYLFLIIFIMSFIFSSLAIFISTRISVGSTIGICIGLSVFIPITSLITAFTNRKTHYSITTNMPDTIKLIMEKNKHNFEKIKNIDLKQIMEKNKFWQIPIDKSINADPQAMWSQLKMDIHDLQNDPRSIYNLNIKIDEKNTFSDVWFLDLNYQIRILSKFAIDEFMNPSIQRMINRNSNSLGIGKNVEKFISEKSNIIKNEKDLNEIIKFSWEKFAIARIATIFSYIYFIKKYEKELNKELEKDQFAENAMKYLWPKSEEKINRGKVFNKTIYDRITKNIQKYIKNQNKIKDWNIKEIKRFSLFFKYIYHILLKFKNTKNKQLQKDANTYIFNANILFPLNSDLSFYEYEKAINYKKHLKFDEEVKMKANPGESTILQWIKHDIVFEYSKENSMKLKYAKFKDYVLTRKSNIVQGKYKPYVTKHTLLYAYIIFGLILLPISYLSIRKRDFR